MNALVPLPVALPLVVAALLVAVRPIIHPRLADAIAATTALATTIVCALLLVHAATRGTLVYWFGGWRPRGGHVVGIAFVADLVGTETAALVSLVASAALVFSYRFYHVANSLYHALMLAFVAGMSGLCLSGDLFDMFVFFELMGVAAYALTAQKPDSSPLEGSMNFAVTNSVAGALILTGIALLYGRTGQLNLALLGQELAAARLDALVVAAFVLIMSGFLIKGAIVPFHFWLPDVHATAPTPASALFSGAMVELGLYAGARVYWTVFAGVMAPYEAQVRAVFLTFAAVTAIVGALMCIGQRHLKRLLAFSTVSHAGVVWMGFALLSEHGTAGALVYLPAHGLLKASLFLAVGILLNAHLGLDELELRGQLRGERVVGALFFVGGLLLAALPPFALFRGKAEIETAALRLGMPWIFYVLTAASLLTGSAVLRAFGRMFLGWGGDDPISRWAPTEAEHPETTLPPEGRPRLTVVAPSIALMLLVIAGSFLPGADHAAARAAAQFQDRAGYVQAVLATPPPVPEPRTPPTTPGEAAISLAFGLAGAGGALAWAAVMLRVPLSRRARRALSHAAGALEHLHSGDVRDYVAWITVGTAALAALFLALLAA